VETRQIQAFNHDDIDNWYDTIALQMPSRPSSSECLIAPEILSYNIRAISTAAVVNFKLSSGQLITLKLNPLLVQYLRKDLLDCGNSSHWLNLDGTLSIPFVQDST
jgi:hypothetical protein